MQLKAQLADAAAEMAYGITAIKSDQLTLPTPCEGYDVRSLVNHLIAWSPIIEAVGLRNQPISARPDEVTDHMTGDWRGEYLSWIDRIVTAWGDDSAWEGKADLGFALVPAAVIGGKTLCEYVLHGWDLARAIGRPFRCDEGVMSAARELVASTAEETRRLGMFGPPVPVPSTASALDHALGGSGRDPHWAACPPKP
jgi:uncharacterized protein (TIGR03086 family)